MEDCFSYLDAAVSGAGISFERDRKVQKEVVVGKNKQNLHREEPEMTGFAYVMRNEIFGLMRQRQRKMEGDLP